MLRPRLTRIGLNFKTFRRSIHAVPELKHNFSEGVPGLLSSHGFDIAWTQYQNLMIEKLNILIAGGEFQHNNTKDIAIKYARDPNSAPIFNYASMAHNNHFFFQCLTPTPTQMPTTLQTQLEGSFSSIETLRREFVITASSMFGPGFVWLMKDRISRYSLLCTYLAGSPYPGAHYRQQPVDMNTENKSMSDAVARMAREAPTNTVGAFGQRSKNQRISPGGIDLTPVLCINMWEHVYLPDYGTGAFGVGGKKAFAESWWHVIDWAEVANNADAMPRKFME